MADKKNKRYH